MNYREKERNVLTHSTRHYVGIAIVLDVAPAQPQHHCLEYKPQLSVRGVMAHELTS